MRSTVPMRLSCPACLGVALEKVSAAPGLDIDHCRRCGGSWILREQTARLRTVPIAAMRAAVTRAQDAAFACHSCHVPMDRDAAACPSCGWDNALECPECGKAMRRQTERDVTVDVCRGCSAVWLDHHEMASIWTVAADRAVGRARMGGRMRAAGMDTGGFLLDSLWYAPDLVVQTAYYGTQAAADVIGAGAEAAAHAPGLLAAAPELVAGAAEGAGEAAGGVFEFIAEIIAGIFEGFG